MREPKNQMLGTMEPPPLMQLSVKIRTSGPFFRISGPNLIFGLADPVV